MSWRARPQADDFFSAYLALSKGEEPADLVLMTPAIVCLAFSLEIYLKGLHFVLTGKAPREHDILKLFDELPSHIKEAIFDHDAVSGNPHMVRGDILSTDIFDTSYVPYHRFIDQMKAISDGFQTWRYSYEHITLSYDSSFAVNLVEAVKSVTDGIRLQQRKDNVSPYE